MPGTARSRTTILPGNWSTQTGTYTRADLPAENHSLTRGSGTTTTCHDVVGNMTRDWLGLLTGDRKARKVIYNPNPLELIHNTIVHGWFSGVKDPLMSYKRTWIKYPGLNPGNPKSAYGTFNLPDKQSRAVKILAGTNISRPHISVPTFIGELPELPGLLAAFGKKQMAKAKASGNIPLYWTPHGFLGYQWGIAPLLADLRALLEGIEEIRKRLDDLSNLRANGYFSRTVQLSRDAYMEPPSSLQILHAMNTGYVYGRQATSYTVTEWGSAQWYVRHDTVLPPSMPVSKGGRWDIPTSDQLWAQMSRLGLTWYEILAAIWELFPWSWLADWFFKIGDFVTAWNNTISLGVRNICLMRRYQSDTAYTIDRSASFAGLGFVKPPSKRQVLKLRFVLTDPTPAGSISTQPFFDPKKWAIIGSLLAVMRGI